MGQLLNTSSVMMCPHGGTVSIVSSNTRVQAGAYVVRPSDTFMIAGCPLNVAGAPHPCVRVQWVVAAMRSKAAGDATLTNASVGLCLAADGAAQGTVLINSTQTRVAGQ
ncbi:MAG: hypothetical protein QOE33_3466 [Acidobacteriota bacterium]|nr:hypothetical protein [Acidobacteriota bacterium]